MLKVNQKEKRGLTFPQLMMLSVLETDMVHIEDKESCLDLSRRFFEWNWDYMFCMGVEMPDSKDKYVLTRMQALTEHINTCTDHYPHNDFQKARALEEAKEEEEKSKTDQEEEGYGALEMEDLIG